MNKDNMPLVSVLVITYNSAHFVIETLNSVRDQTYRNIELIISDDGSTDSTLDLCHQWLKDNEGSFVKASLITTVQNTGTAGNCNRAFKHANGKWIKFFGADDILMPDAIQNYISFVEGTDKNIVIAEAIHFSGDLCEKQFTYERIALEKVVFSESISSNMQYRILSKIFIGSGPTAFFSRECIQTVGAFDERFPLQEDYPLYIRLTKAGYKIHLMPVDTVYKRVHSGSVSHSMESNAIYPSMIVRCIKDYKYDFKRQELGFVWRQFLTFSNWLHSNVIDSGNNKDSVKCVFYYRLQVLLDPFAWYTRFLNLLDKLR